MTTPSRLLDFFTLEATEYLSRLEAAVATDPPDTVGLRSAARGLRGSATMARATGIAGLAGRLETVASKLAEGDLALSPALQRVMAATVETLATLVRSVRSWTPDQDAKVAAAMRELDFCAPVDAEPEDVIVPIAQLYYSDAGPHVIEVAPSARTTFEQRLREKQAKAPEPPGLSPALRATPSSSGLRGAALRDALGSSLAQMRSLERPGEPPALAVVPIQTLLYRGQSAVRRSKDLRAQILAAASAPSRELIAELCDLVELASAE